MAGRHADTRSQYRAYDSRDGRRGQDRRDEDRYRSRGHRRSRSPEYSSRRRSRERDRDRGRDARDRSRERPRYRDDRDYRKRDESRERDGRRYRERTRSPRSPRSDKLRRDDNAGKNKTSEQDAEKQAKLDRLNAWKAKMEQQQQQQQAVKTSNGTITLPAVASPKADTPQTKTESNVANTAKPKAKPSAGFVLDKGASKGSQSPVAPILRKSVEVKDKDTTTAPPRTVEPIGNVSSFGLKKKSEPTVDKPTTKNALFDEEEEVTQKRTFEKLEDYVPDELPEDYKEEEEGEEAAMSDTEDAAAAMAAAEKRRLEANDADVDMADVPSAAEVEETQNNVPEPEEEVDPLDAFMADLDTAPPPSRSAPRGDALFGDENEVNMEAVEGQDDFAAALAAKKKKREIPVVDHSKAKYKPFRKNFYVEPIEVQEMTEEDVADLRLELDGIKVRAPKSVTIPRPVTKWGHMGLSAQTLEVLRTIGYDRPTAIQCQAIPVAESGLDMISVAKTGSGKTLAFGIPFIRHIKDQEPLSKQDGPIVLILAPTRELSLQIVKELKPFLKASGLHITCAYGGAPIKDQIGEIRRGGIHVLCATPGRLIDLLASNSGRVLSFQRITYVVLDEADRMFDMGFEPQVNKILANVRPDRQTVLFSATFPKNMESLAKKILHKPCEIIVGGRSVVAPEIEQIVRAVPADKKMNEVLLYLGKVLSEDEDARALIFVERQETAEDLLSQILHRGYPCNSIHGAKDQVDRTDAINDFKSGAIPILVATSVAARGLDILQLKLVINYDCPSHLEDYVHRCGRTGRAGNKGTAVTLIEKPGQERFSVHIAKSLEQSGQPIPPELQGMVEAFMAKVKAGTEKYHGGGFGGHGLDKLSADREKEKMREKRMFKTGDEKEEEEEEKEEEIKVTARGGSPTPAARPGPSLPSHLPDLDASSIVVKKTERPAATTTAGGPGGGQVDRMAAAKAAAAAIDGRLSKKGMVHAGTPIDNKGPDAGAYHATVEINDFPQKARWAVTNRTNVAKILDSTGTSITTKGNYYGAGSVPGENDAAKLYILVEGETENVVASAMRELYRLLKEGTLAAADADSRAPTGRYTVT